MDKKDIKGWYYQVLFFQIFVDDSINSTRKKNVSPYFVDPLKQAKYEWKNTTDMSMVSIQICMGVPAVFTNIFVEKFDHHGYIQILLFEKTALKSE